MKVFSWNELDSLSRFVRSSDKKSALTIGGFDGPHIGHKALLDAVLAKGRTDGFLTGVVTFRFTDEFISKKNERKKKTDQTDRDNNNNFSGTISTSRLKTEVFDSLGFDFCLIIDFSEDFSKIKGIDFLKMLRESCSMQFLTVGSDFRCGYNLDTGVAEISDYAKQFGLEFFVCNQVLHDGMKVSSSTLRSFVREARFSEVNRLLVSPFSLDVRDFSWNPFTVQNDNSSVFNGLEVANDACFQILPKNGVYKVKVISVGKESEAGFVSKLYVESTFLRLEVPLEQGFVRPSKIIFI